MNVLRPLILASVLVAPLWALPTAAQPAGAAESDAALPPEAEEGPEGLLYVDGSDVDISTFLWTKRLLVVMADTPADPAFEQQLRNIREREEEFVIRDVVVITDTTPAARSPIRQELRPRGFMLAIIDKDGEVKQRRPAPRTAREIMAVIDRFPSRRQEILDQMPSGRD